MNLRALATAWHTAHIFLLMLLRPARLFARINALPWYRDTLQHWARATIGTQPATVLEAGCATGELAHTLAKHGHTVTGVDASTAMLKRAQTTGASSAQFIQGSVMRLPFNAAQFDHVIAASLLNAVDDPVGALREMARACKPGGSVSVLVPQAGVPIGSVATLADEFQIEGFSRAAMLVWLNMARKLTVITLEDYFSSAGFGNITSQQYLNGIVTAVTGTR